MSAFLDTLESRVYKISAWFNTFRCTNRKVLVSKLNGNEIVLSNLENFELAIIWKEDVSIVIYKDWKKKQCFKDNNLLTSKKARWRWTFTQKISQLVKFFANKFILKIKFISLKLFYVNFIFKKNSHYVYFRTFKNTNVIIFLQGSYVYKFYKKDYKK